MAESSKKSKRYLLRDSDRDGFTYKYNELVSDGGFLVGPGEFDAPPPSNRLYPGEGDISPGDTRQFYTSYTDPTAAAIHVQYVTAAGGINLFFTPDNSNFKQDNSVSGYFQVAGSNANVTVTVNPQIQAAAHGKMITLECVGSAITLSNSTGLHLYTAAFRMTSGTLINMIYNATDNLWYETSRGSTFGLLGAF